ncbi:ABC transporter ATP-binding protein [Ruegeria sediminis]|uniref:ABC transporter ATP-binding protein n=1 Tax=Ruegeria sediminis TaxID=2583820 RepID=A0ABY2WY49_9RHOB|nr:ABC transporter ATP-binding protein [Ruegeria sediminis]TMV07797.1 ABC transporter ATP-binding protein [Ruegeria sediminis]
MKIERFPAEHERNTGITLSLADVGFDLEGKTILDGVSFEISATRIGIVGRNGSGKSTLARLLAGLVSPTKGELKINGLDLAKDRKAALAEVGILFQNPDHQIIFPTVQEEISFGLQQQGRSKRDAADRTAATLSEFEKSHWTTAHINALSQGQKHLVCMMAVVAMEPKLIILDEPFTGLDLPTKTQLKRYLSRYQGGLVHISHDPVDLLNYEKVIWLDQGQLISLGDAAPILNDYIEKMKRLGGLDDISDLSR